MIEWNGKKLAEEISNHISDSVVSSDDNSVHISREKIYEVLKFLKETSGFSFDLLSSITAVDYIDHFEVVYQLKSLITLSKATVKVKLGFGREDQPDIISPVAIEVLIPVLEIISKVLVVPAKLEELY